MTCGLNTARFVSFNSIVESTRSIKRTSTLSALSRSTFAEELTESLLVVDSVPQKSPDSVWKPELVVARLDRPIVSHSGWTVTMRERVTFIHPQGTGLDLAALDVQAAGLVGPQTEATREDRLTLTLDELPLEVADLLQSGLRDLSLRWTTPLSYDTLEPFISRLSPGLHLTYTPSKGATIDQSVYLILPFGALLTPTGLSFVPSCRSLVL